MSVKRPNMDAQTSTRAKRRKSNGTSSNVEDLERGSLNRARNDGHIRFGSEEPSHPDGEQNDSAEEFAEAEPLSASDSSDDEEPEAVATIGAQASVLAAAIEAGRVAERQRAQSRKKRQDADKRLKAQSKKSRNKLEKNADVESDASEADKEDMIDYVESTKKNKPSRIPDLLPDELLTDDLFERPPTPEADANPSMSRRRPGKKLIKFDSTPKDMRAGPVNVSVLEKSNRYLPPKANKTSRNLKEEWLAGRRGKGGRFEGRTAYRKQFVSV